MDRIYNSYFFNKHYEEQGGGNYVNETNPFRASFDTIAANIVEEFSPKTVLDAGCATGYLVEALRKRGVEAYGIDISSYAINHVSQDIKDYCAVCDITGPLPENFPQKYDLIVTIEVLEHLYEEQGKKAIFNLCNYSDKIIFTSTPDDISDQTHINVQRSEYWCRIFAQKSFYRNLFQPVNWICPWALLFEKRQAIPDVINEYEIKIRLDKASIEDSTALINSLKIEIEKAKSENKRLDMDCNEVQEKLLLATQEIQEKNEEKIKIENSEQNKQEIIAYLRELIDHYEKVKIEDVDIISNLRIDLGKKEQECSVLLHNLKAEQIQMQYFKSLYEGIEQANAWKMTKPIRYLADRVKRVIKRENIIQNQYENIIDTSNAVLEKHEKKAFHKKNDLTTAHRIDEIKTIIVDEPIRRLNLVTDTIEPSSLLGGVATALIVATEFVLKYDYELRIITRTAAVNPLNYKNIIQLNGLEIPQKVSYYCDCENTDFKLEISPDDIFFATSWWSAEAIRKTSLRNRFFYIIQEVETFFYPHGVEHYLCSRMMKNENVDFIINSHYLYDYFLKYEPNIAERGVFFEPAFSEKMFSLAPIETKKKYKLFFYARPNNPRNMYTYGVYLIDLAFKKGIIDEEEWEVYFAGQQVPDVSSRTDIKVHCLGQLSWQEYTEFLKEVDLTISLMYTPHPSYPPYDAACSGSVVVTNKCLNKQAMPECKNIITAELDEMEFLKAIKEGVALAKNLERRVENYNNNTIRRDWGQTLVDVLKFMKDRI